MHDVTSLVSLRAALNKATPGPWEARIVAESPVNDDDAELLVTDTDGMDICRVDFAPFEDGRHEDAALIVAAVNALPVLLTVAEAAQAVGAQDVHLCETCSNVRALREALAALKEQT